MKSVFKRILGILVRFIMLLIILIANNILVFSDTSRKTTDTAEGKLYIYYDSENKEIAREVSASSLDERKLISGEVPDGIVKEEGQIQGNSYTTMENYLNGRSNGLCKTTMNGPAMTMAMEYNYINGVKEGQANIITDMNGMMSSNTDFNFFNGEVNGLSRTTLFDKDGKIMFSMEMFFKNNKPTGEFKYYDKNGNYDAEMSKKMQDSMGKRFNPGNFLPKKEDEKETDILKDKNILLITSSGSEKELKTVKKILELNGGKTIITGDKSIQTQLDIKDIDAIVIMGSSESSKSLWKIKSLIDYIKQANTLGKVIGAIGFSPVILAKAGILKYRDATITENEETLVIFKDNEVNYTKKDVVVSEKIVTAEGKGALTKFIKEIIKLLGKKAEEE